MSKHVHDDECVENSNVLTNFKKEKRPLYEAAIKCYGKGYVFITDDAYWLNGRKDDSMCALRFTVYKDYSEFWRIFDALQSVRG
jgi:hypothetical protein